MTGWSGLLGAAMILAGAFLLGNSALAVDPDRVREETRPRIIEYDARATKEDKGPGAGGAVGLSDAFKKYHTVRMLTWRVSGSSSIVFMGQFNSDAHCTAAQKMLQRQLVRWGWGRAQCLEITLP